MAVDLGPHGVPRVLRFLRLRLDAPSSVAAEGLLVSSCGRLHSTGASDPGLRGLSSLVAGRGEMVVIGSSSGSSSLCPSIYRCFSNWLGHSSFRLDSSRGLVSGEEGTSHQCVGDEGGWSCP